MQFSVFCCELLIGYLAQSVFTNTCLVACVCLNWGLILREFLALFLVNVQMIVFES